LSAGGKPGGVAERAREEVQTSDVNITKVGHHLNAFSSHENYIIILKYSVII
jgi:hypothetical protein